MTFLVDGTLGGTFPSWTTATRPASPIVGQMGYNTTTGKFDQYTAAGWTSVSTQTTGQVLQVVSNVYSTQTAFTSTSFVNTGLAATITPTSSTSKILIICSNSVYASTSNWIGIQVLRGATGIGVPYVSIGYKNDSYGISYPMAFNLYDSPATTSSTTYTLQCKSPNGGSITVQNDNVPATMTLLEIAA